MYYHLWLPTEPLDVYLWSDGQGWTAPEDLVEPVRACCMCLSVHGCMCLSVPTWLDVYMWSGGLGWTAPEDLVEPVRACCMCLSVHGCMCLSVPTWLDVYMWSGGLGWTAPEDLVEPVRACCMCLSVHGCMCLSVPTWLDVYMWSGGLGRTAPEDLAEPVRDVCGARVSSGRRARDQSLPKAHRRQHPAPSCRTLSYMQFSCDVTSAPQRCPRVELYNVNSGRLINGFGGNGSHATWGKNLVPSHGALRGAAWHRVHTAAIVAITR